MKTTRRKLLSLLGFSGAAAALAPALVADRAVASDTSTTTAFRFQCFCGESVIASVPKDNKKEITVNCDKCHHGYNLKWNGDHFSFSDSWVRANADMNEPLEPAGPMFVDRAGLERDIAAEAMDKLKGGAFRHGETYEIDPPTPRARR